LVVHWPGKIKAGSQSGHVAAFWDWLPTLADAIGAASPAGIDGISFLPTLLDSGQQQLHDHLYWEFHESGGRQALRKGDWKLVMYQVQNATKTTLELFDLANDPEERNNVALDHPALVAELGGLMQKAHLPNPIFRQLD